MKTTDFPKVVAIVGSRKFTKRERIYNLIEGLNGGTIVVSGGASKGVDNFVKILCGKSDPTFTHVFYKEFPVESFEWGTFGKVAGHLRNADLIDYVQRRGGLVLVFTLPSELTPGSKNVLDYCKKHKVEHYHMLQSVPSEVLIQPCPYCQAAGCAYCDVYDTIEKGWRPV